MINQEKFQNVKKRIIDIYNRTHPPKPEEYLEYSDWMGIPIQGYQVTLDRFKSLLAEQAKVLLGR